MEKRFLYSQVAIKSFWKWYVFYFSFKIVTLKLLTELKIAKLISDGQKVFGKMNSFKSNNSATD